MAHIRELPDSLKIRHTIQAKGGSVNLDCDAEYPLAEWDNSYLLELLSLAIKSIATAQVHNRGKDQSTAESILARSIERIKAGKKGPRKKIRDHLHHTAIALYGEHITRKTLADLGWKYQPKANDRESCHIFRVKFSENMEKLRENPQIESLIQAEYDRRQAFLENLDL